MDDASFRGDCGRCAGLCCVLLSFERGPQFGFDKPAGEPCRHLDACHRCAIHDRLEASGFSGCRHYDCSGAGQVVTAMFEGPERTPATERAIAAAFAIVREVQLLRLALRRMLPSVEATELEQRLAQSLAGYSSLIRLDLADVRRCVVALAGRHASENPGKRTGAMFGAFAAR
jgi:hypothetical protein